MKEFHVDLERGIDLVGEVALTTPVSRTLRIGSTLPSFASGQIKASDLTDPTHQLGELDHTVSTFPYGPVSWD